MDAVSLRGVTVEGKIKHNKKILDKVADTAVYDQFKYTAGLQYIWDQDYDEKIKVAGYLLRPMISLQALSFTRK
jgi:hypothetical protein